MGRKHPASPTWANLAYALIGVWFVIAPFVLGFTDKAVDMWTSVIGGIILLVPACSAALARREDSPFSWLMALLEPTGIFAGALIVSKPLSGVTRQRAWGQYVNGVVGIWFIAAPFALGFTSKPVQFWTSETGGFVTLALSAWLAFGVRSNVAN